MLCRLGLFGGDLMPAKHPIVLTACGSVILWSDDALLLLPVVRAVRDRGLVLGLAQVGRGPRRALGAGGIFRIGLVPVR